MRSDPASAAPRRSPWHRQAGAFARRTLRELARNRSSLVWGLLAPVAFFLLSSGLGSPATGGPGGASVAFGLFGTASVSVGIFLGSLRGDLTSKRYRKLRSLPVSPSADAVGRFAGGFAFGTASFLLVLLAGVLRGAAVEPRSALSPVIALGALFALSLVGMAGTTAAVAAFARSDFATRASNLGVLALFFATGVNGLRPRMAVGPVGEYVNLIPNSLATRLVVYHLLPVAPAASGGPPWPAGPEYLLLLVGYALGLVVVAGAVMRRQVYGGEAGE